MTDRFRVGATNNAGKLIFDDPSSVKALIAELGPRVTVTFETEGKNRTGPQNNLLWRIYTFIAQEAESKWKPEEHDGYPPPTKDDIHRDMGKEHLSYLRPMLNGKVSLLIRSTADLDTKEFSEYIDNVCATAANLGIFVPMPGDTE